MDSSEDKFKKLCVTEKNSKIIDYTLEGLSLSTVTVDGTDFGAGRSMDNHDVNGNQLNLNAGEGPRSQAIEIPNVENAVLAEVIFVLFAVFATFVISFMLYFKTKCCGDLDDSGSEDVKANRGEKWDWACCHFRRRDCTTELLLFLHLKKKNVSNFQRSFVPANNKDKDNVLSANNKDKDNVLSANNKDKDNVLSANNKDKDNEQSANNKDKDNEESAFANISKSIKLNEESASRRQIFDLYLLLLSGSEKEEDRELYEDIKRYDNDGLMVVKFFMHLIWNLVFLEVILYECKEIKVYFPEYELGRGYKDAEQWIEYGYTDRQLRHFITIYSTRVNKLLQLFPDRAIKSETGIVGADSDGIIEVFGCGKSDANMQQGHSVPVSGQHGCLPNRLQNKSLFPIVTTPVSGPPQVALGDNIMNGLFGHSEINEVGDKIKSSKYIFDTIRLKWLKEEENKKIIQDYFNLPPP